MPQEEAVNTHPRRTYRVIHRPKRYSFVIENQQTVEDDEPTSYTEAVKDVNSSEWLQAMESEIDVMHENKVWTLVPPPEGIVPIGCKWVFKRKTDADGNIQTYKARIVAKGYRQKQGVDFDEIFSPIAMIKSIRIMLAIAAYHDYEVWQMDVKTAFLNGFLKEEVYMTQPKGFESKGQEHMVCKL